MCRGRVLSARQNRKAFIVAEKFHIAEWYGHSFFDLTSEQRLKFAQHRVGASSMTKKEREAFSQLQEKEEDGSITEKEEKRLAKLRSKLDALRDTELPCPFKANSFNPTCTKVGGVCSMRLYSNEDGIIRPVDGDKGALRITCPYRFHQDNSVFKAIGDKVMADPTPLIAPEVKFLESSKTLDSGPGHVGRIDMIVVKSNVTPDAPMTWCAVEIQAVYFSGKKMQIEFDKIIELDGELAMPQENRRLDYRSSGPKRLMPQLQIKVPTLSRWGKKMCVVVDKAFFQSLGEMPRIAHISNAEIVWVVVNLVPSHGVPHYEIEVVDLFFTDLMQATSALTGGKPVSADVFEKFISAKSVRMS